MLLARFQIRTLMALVAILAIELGIRRVNPVLGAWMLAITANAAFWALILATPPRGKGRTLAEGRRTVRSPGTLAVNVLLSAGITLAVLTACLRLSP